MERRRLAADGANAYADAVGCTGCAARVMTRTAAGRRRSNMHDRVLVPLFHSRRSLDLGAHDAHLIPGTRTTQSLP
jgi:hypothetical protein